MNDRDQRRLDRLSRVQTFMQTNTGDFAAGGEAQALATALNALIDRVGQARSAQAPLRVSKETLLDALVLDVRGIARTARAIEFTTPGFAAGFETPVHPSEAAAKTQAERLLQTLEDGPDDAAEQKTAKAALRARFVKFEMPADFVADLRADYEALTATGRGNQVETLEGVESTAQIGVLLAEGREIVQQLDAAVRNRYARNPEKLAAWQSASHVERSPQRPRATANTTITAAPAAAG